MREELRRPCYGSALEPWLSERLEADPFGLEPRPADGYPRAFGADQGEALGRIASGRELWAHAIALPEP